MAGEGGPTCELEMSQNEPIWAPKDCVEQSHCAILNFFLREKSASLSNLCYFRYLLLVAEASPKRSTPPFLCPSLCPCAVSAGREGTCHRAQGMLRACVKVMDAFTYPKGCGTKEGCLPMKLSLKSNGNYKLNFTIPPISLCQIKFWLKHFFFLIQSAEEFVLVEHSSFPNTPLNSWSELFPFFSRLYGHYWI